MSSAEAVCIFGRSGTGKTELLKRLILSDINSGHGVFFLDPHDDAIDDLIRRMPPHRVSDVISLSPMDETHTFAINLLACQNIDSWTEREHAYTRAKGVFDKLWRNAIVDVPWLQLIIEYTLPVFIQNPDYTLSEAPIFLTDPDFRDHLLGNVRYDVDVVRFWRHEFHQKQAEAAITRVRMLLGRPPVKHIVSQRETTLDFTRLLEENRIVFFKLPASLAIDTKTFIGLILLVRAQKRTRVLLNIFETAKGLRRSLRGLDRFLTAVMEGAIALGQEQFSDFLISLVRGFSGVAKEHAHTLELYIALSYGDGRVPRSLDFEFAQTHGLFSPELALLMEESERKTREERARFQETFIQEKVQQGIHWRQVERHNKRLDERERIEPQIARRRRHIGDISSGIIGTVGGINSLGVVFGSSKNYLWNPPNVYTQFVWWQRFPKLQKTLAPFRRGRFEGKRRFLIKEQSAREFAAKVAESLDTVKPWESGFDYYMHYFKPATVRALRRFLFDFEEGALVILALIDCAERGCWGAHQGCYFMTTSEFPTVSGYDPIDVWCLLEEIRTFMAETLREMSFTSAFKKLFELPSLFENEEGMKESGFRTVVASCHIYEWIGDRDDVKALELLLSNRWDWFATEYKGAAATWRKFDACRRYYVLCRAADRLSFGEEYPTLPPSSPANEAVVEALVGLGRDTQERREEMEEREEAAKELGWIHWRCAEEVAKIGYAPPVVLEPRVLTFDQIQWVKQACVASLSQADAQTQNVVATINEFVSFCELLRLPENHILVPSRQYIQKQVNTRLEQDMVNKWRAN